MFACLVEFTFLAQRSEVVHVCLNGPSLSKIIFQSLKEVPPKKSAAHLICPLSEVVSDDDAVEKKERSKKKQN